LGSGINNDVGAKNTDDKIADIRSSIGLVPNLHSSGNSWTRYNWANPTGKDYDEVLITPSYLGSFIGAWMKGIPDNVRTSFDQGAEEHWKCDINTATGHFLPPIASPDSMVNHSRIDPALESRRLNWCSELFIQRRNPNPQSRHNNSRPPKNDRRNNPCNRVRYKGPVILTARSVKLEICEVPEKKIKTPEYQRFVPRIPCFLRPAEKFDMEAVRCIYNWEVEHGMQALDFQPLSVDEFEKILGTAQQLGMPFIVAVRGSARDLGLTKGNLAYSPFRQMPFQDKDKRGEILGFGFLSVWQPGLAGSGIGSSRASAKMNVFVHHEYRRKKIGFSLLDMLLTAASDRFSSQSGYDFVDPDDSPVFKNSRDRERQYFRVYSSFRVKHQLRAGGNKKLEEEQKGYDNDLVWAKVLHEDMLNFTEIVRLEAVHRSPQGREGPVCWMDEVLFEHTCFFDPTQVKEGY
jgi:GNAT superfamily N-acetyltransferase